MTLDKLPCSVQDGIGLCTNGKSRQMAPEIFAEMLNGAIPPLWLFPQRHHDDVVELTAETTRELRRSSSPQGAELFRGDVRAPSEITAVLDRPENDFTWRCGVCSQIVCARRCSGSPFVA